jgi:hypothetical protein
MSLRQLRRPGATWKLKRTPAIRRTLDEVATGLKFNDVPSLRAAFWPDAKLFFVKRDGSLGQLSQQE